MNSITFEDGQRLVTGLQNLLENDKTLLTKAQTELDSFREKSTKTDAKIIVTAVISNSGDGSTTLMPQALLRTDLGQGNYLDIDLYIPKYETSSSEIKPRSASIIKLESPPISDMSPSDQDRFRSFFKNTSPTNLYIKDVKNHYYKSNTIPFAQGIYEQKIYDGLKSYASNRSGG